MRRRFIGNDQTRASAVQAVEATGMTIPPPKALHPGNLTGLDNLKSAYLQHSQGGYFNPRIQRARYSTASIRNAIPSTAMTINMPPIAGRLMDKRIGKGGSSLAKLFKTMR